MDDGNPRQFDTVLFDLDGVITSELAYWKAAALTVYEYFCEDLELNSEYCYENADSIMDTVFSYRNTITTVKSLGINSNWDLAYAVILSVDILRSEGLEDDEIFSLVPEFLQDKNVLAPELLAILSEEYEGIFNYPEGYACKGGPFYQEIVRKFQHWYLGDKEYFCTYGETPQSSKGDEGFMHSEEPLLGEMPTKTVLECLKNAGYQLGVGTGRPNREALRPLEKWGILSYFDQDKFVGYQQIKEWQTLYQKEYDTDEMLVKPHPFQFIKAAMGDGFGLHHLKENISLSRVLVVGDALCDLLAAKAAGCKFCAVLTGIDGKDGKPFFENMEADYIIDDITGLPALLGL